MRLGLNFSPLVLLKAFLFIVLSSSTGMAKWYSSFTESSLAITVEERLSKMSLKEKVGQLFLFGFSGKDFSRSLEKTVSELKPGGIIFFGRNIHSLQQTASLNYSLQRASFKNTGLPLLIALDQEGGDVTRIQFNPPLPSALAIGMAGDPIISERMGYLIGSLIKSLGFNMNLAPVLDISNPDVASFIGTRSFGKNPSHVAALGSAYAKGLEMAQVLSTGKHFPGHGNVITDSHQGLPYKSTTLAQLLAADLLPYSLFTKSLRSSAVMIAHIAFPKIDTSRMPATFSKVIVSDILRKQMKYQGLIITDDLEMAATNGIESFEERTIRAIEAGADMIMVAWSRRAQRKAVAAVLSAATSGRLDISQIDEAVRRVLTAKMRVASLEKIKKPNLGQLKKIVKSQYIEELTDTILEKNFYHSLNLLNEKSFIWSDRPVYIFSGNQRFFNEFKNSTELSTIWIPYQSQNLNNYNHTMQRAKRSFGIFYVTGRKTAQMANRLHPEVKKRTLVVSATTPGFINSPQKFVGIVNIFSKHPKAGKLTAKNIIRKQLHFSKQQ